MRITSKGQLTVPAEIRERAGLLPQDGGGIQIGWQGRAHSPRKSWRERRSRRPTCRSFAEARRRPNKHERHHGADPGRLVVAVLTDSNVLLDVMTEDARWVSWSAASIEKVADRFRLVINPVVYAEVSVRY